MFDSGTVKSERTDYSPVILLAPYPRPTRADGWSNQSNPVGVDADADFTARSLRTEFMDNTL